MKIRPTVIRLIPEGNPRGSAACRRSHKSANCHAATEWQDRKTDMRMKPELVEQQSSGTYQGCGGRQLPTPYRMYPSKCLGCMGQRTDCDTSAISRLTDERCIRQSVMLVITPAKWGLPKPKRLHMAKGSSYIINIIKGKCERHYEKSKECIEQLSETQQCIGL